MQRKISRSSSFEEYFWLNPFPGGGGLPGIRVYSFCHSFFQPHWQPKPRSYPYIQVSMILSGEDRYLNADGDRVVCGPGFFSVSDLNHARKIIHHRKGVLERYFVLLEVNPLLRSILLELFPDGLPRFDPPQPVRLRRCFEDILRQLRKKSEVDDVMLGAMGYRLLCEAARQLKPDSPLPDKLAAALRHIDNHYCDPGLTRRDTASAAGMSVVLLGKLFQEHLHTTMNRHVIRLRLEKACHLLKNTGLPVENIAVQCGFSYSSYFARVFKCRYGKTPLEYRNEKSAG